jgi:tetratricopeptide (TPR) repeat protein
MTIRGPASIGFAFALTLMLAGGSARAELELPRPSPFAKVSQDVGLTTITVDYSSPGVKGRKIWGGLVPYDKMWRTGANRATKITFSRDVTFAGKPVPAGTYALFTIPTKADWTVILNKRADQAGTGTGYKQDEDLLRVAIKPKAAPMRERMTFLFSDFTDEKGSLDLEWEKLRLSIPIGVATEKQALASINATLDDTWRVYANAARYMLENKKDYDAGLKYIDQSLALKEDWFNVFIKAELLAAKGRYKEAYPLAEKAQGLGQKSENFFLDADVKKALADWKKKV